MVPDGAPDLRARTGVQDANGHLVRGQCVDERIKPVDRGTVQPTRRHIDLRRIGTGRTPAIVVLDDLAPEGHRADHPVQWLPGTAVDVECHERSREGANRPGTAPAVPRRRCVWEPGREVVPPAAATEACGVVRGSRFPGGWPTDGVKAHTCAGVDQMPRAPADDGLGIVRDRHCEGVGTGSRTGAVGAAGRSGTSGSPSCCGRGWRMGSTVMLRNGSPISMAVMVPLPSRERQFATDIGPVARWHAGYRLGV